MKVLLAASLLLGTLACHTASAQNPLDMVGTWKGEATAAHIGANPYRETEGSDANLPSKVLEFTFDIKEQQGNRFAGTSTAGGRSETIIGALSPDGKTGVMLDDDGQYLLTIEEPNTVDVCYFHKAPTGQVVACYALKRAQ